MYTTVRGVVPDQPVGPETTRTDSEGSGSGIAPATAGGGRARRVGRVVVLLGLVSLFTDLSSEMVSAILPLYLLVFLHLSPLQYGVVDGLYGGVTAAVRIIGGLAADLTRRPKLVASIGYGISAFCKLLFLPAHSFASVSFAVSMDRSGKGIRTAPRDALIAASATPGNFGLAFGVHRALDTVGALGGPLIATAVLVALPTGYSAIFLLSFAVALIGLALLVLTVPDLRPAALPGANPEAKSWRQRGAEWRARIGRPKAADGYATGSQEHETGPSSSRVGLRAAGRMGREMLGHGSVVRVMLVAGLLSLATVGDGFVYLSLRETVGVSDGLFPLLFVGTSMIYLALAIPLGKLADKRGRSVIFIVGHLAAAGAYLILLSGTPRLVLIGVVLALLGVYYAATDGVLSALVSPLVPAGARSTALSLVQTAVAVGRMVAAIGFGFVWSSVGQQQALGIYGGALLLMIAVVVPLLRGVDTAGTSQQEAQPAPVA